MKYLKEHSMEALFEMIAVYTSMLRDGTDHEGEQRLKMMINRLEEEVRKRKEKGTNNESNMPARENE